MSFNRTLVACASSVLVALGTQAPKVFTNNSPECLQSLANEASNTVISFYCGKDFGNDDLLVMIVIGGVVFLGITFWKDILQYFVESNNEKS